MTDITLITDGSKVLLVLFSLLAIGLSYFVYRKTIPPVSTVWQVFFIVLRSLAIILIILMLFEPILSVTRQKQEKPIVAVLVDNSASMGLVDEKVTRSDELGKVLADGIFSGPSKDIQLKVLPFAGDLSEEKQPGDSLSLNEDGTDIGKALEQVKEKFAEKYFAAVILISDGADNLGENPARYAENYGVPIHTVGIGDPAEQKDVLITNYVTNEIVYAGNDVPVDVYIKSSGFENHRIPVNLVSGEKTLDTKIITLSGNGLEQKVRLNFKPEAEGLQKYAIRLPALENELTKINNSKTFYVKVLKSKLRIAVFAGGPSAEFLFLTQTFNKDENVQLTPFVEKQNGMFYQGSFNQDIENYDCFILLDFPRPTSANAVLEKLRTVSAKGKPFFLITGKNVDYNKLWVLSDFMPFETEPAKTVENLVYLKVLPQGIFNPLFRIHEDEFENQQSWQELPPVFVNVRPLQPRNFAQVLAGIDLDRTTKTINRSVPLITSYNSGKRKCVVVLAYNLWRWDLLMQGFGRTSANYTRFLQNTVRWLTTTDDSKLVRITSNKEIYRSGEEIKFTAQVYYEDYQPVDGAEVTVQLSGNNESQELFLANIGDGRYEGSFRVLEGGDYSFIGAANQNGRLLGRGNGKFSVEEFKLEYQNTRMNEDLLKRLARVSGGNYFTPDSLSGLTKKLSFPQKFIELKSEWEIWNRPNVLIFCIVILATEWFIRKRKGML